MKYINDLINYCIEYNILNPRDKIYAMNQILYLLDLNEGFEIKDYKVEEDIDAILDNVVGESKKYSNNMEKELFKSKVMACLMDKPSQVENKFYEEYKISPQNATNYFYKLSSDVNYIKKKQIAKNIVYEVKSKYGNLDITINLSKPEKTPEEIKLLKEQENNTNWPLCFLCKEEEGFYGTLKNPDRSNHRLIQVNLNGKQWYFQYSPFSYYNEHSILLSAVHEDMKIDRNTFENLLEFVDNFPHYMIGSNADLPIVGGSMLTHDHYQAGKYEFPIFKVNNLYEIQNDNIKVEILNWALSTIRLTSNSKNDILNEAESILNKWIDYSNESLGIIAKTDARHNTITPIVRKLDEVYEVYLILRNNRTSNSHPDGIFHPHIDKHHIKKENIGLIEAIGLAVLPGRLLYEMNLLKDTIMNKKLLPKEIEKHISYYNKFKDYKEVDLDIKLKEEIGKTFESVLEDCSVFKNNIEEFKDFYLL